MNKHKQRKCDSVSTRVSRSVPYKLYLKCTESKGGGKDRVSAHCQQQETYGMSGDEVVPTVLSENEGRSWMGTRLCLWCAASTNDTLSFSFLFFIFIFSFLSFTSSSLLLSTHPSIPPYHGPTRRNRTRSPPNKRPTNPLRSHPHPGPYHIQLLWARPHQPRHQQTHHRHHPQLQSARPHLS